MLCDDRSCNGKESQTPTLATELTLRADVEEREIPRYQMMRDARCFVQHIYLSLKNILCLFVCVWRDVACGSGLDAVEAGGQVGWVVLGLSSDARW